MADAVLIAFFAFATELLKVIRLGMEGQTAEQKEKMWGWYVADVEKWRKRAKIDEA